MQDRQSAANPHREHGPRSDSEQAARSAAGSRLTNRDPVNSKILRFGIDSLYLSFPGRLSEEAAVRLDLARNAARSDLEIEQAEAQISILDHLFSAGPGGGKLFKYRLKDYAYHLQIKGSKSKSLPLAYVQIASMFITAVGVEQAVDQLKLILSSLGRLDALPNVSRIDLFADYVSDVPLDAWTDEAWVTRANFIDTHRVRGQFTGWSIGRGNIAARLYDKTLEIKSSGKDYLLDLWRQQGWQEGQTVYRVEFQFRSEVLRQLQSAQYPHILSRLGMLWHYGVYDWLRLTQPNPDDQTKSRWPTHPLWEVFQSIPWTGAGNPERIDLKLSQAPADEILARYYFTALTSFMAAKQINNADHAARLLFECTRAHYEDKDRFKEEGFYGQAQSRAAKKAIQYGLSFPGATEIAKAAQDHAAAERYRKASGR
jgi:hypothetical protein